MKCQQRRCVSEQLIATTFQVVPCHNNFTEAEIARLNQGIQSF